MFGGEVFGFYGDDSVVFDEADDAGDRRRFVGFDLDGDGTFGVRALLRYDDVAFAVAGRELAQSMLMSMRSPVSTAPLVLLRWIQGALGVAENW